MIFTFYSYKGGVGRSMAVAAVARALALRGLRVLAVDFDLEAPGLERYFYDTEGSRRRREDPGLIDLIGQYKQALTSEAAFARAEFQQLDVFQLPAIHSAGTRGGSVHLLSAGCREPADKLREYALTVRNFDWQDFFYNWKGDRFFDWLRRRWLSADKGGFDLVLVDSRTGVTEMGGVCAYQLADAVVMLCAPNWQNLEGTRDVARDFVSDSVRALRRGKPLQTLAIPARLAPEHARRGAFLEDFAREMGALGLPKVLADAGQNYERLALGFDAELSVGEQVFGGASTPDAKPSAFEQDIERLASALLLMTDASGALASARAEAAELLAGRSVQQARPLEADTSRSSAGYDVYLDYGAGDREPAQQLFGRLAATGIRVFFDEVTLAPGAAWERQLELALSYSANLLLLFGRSSTTPVRERLLVTARRQSRIRIIPVLLPGADPQALRSFGLDGVLWLDLRDGADGPAWQQLLALLPMGQERERHGGDGAPMGNPYAGARAFDESEAAHFFGRDRDIQALADALHDQPVVLLQGPAQVGKTSLVRAGLVPWLRAPGRAVRLKTVRYLEARESEWPTWPARAQKPSRGSGGGFDLLVVDHLDSQVDQGPGAAERLARLIRLARAAPDGRRLLIVRRCDDGPSAPELNPPRAARVSLEPLAAADLRQAIEGPARNAGQLLEPGLAERLIEGAGPARNAVALIQRVLPQLWERRRRGWLTNQALDDLGQLTGVFVAHAQAVVGALPPPRQQAVQALCLALASVDDGGAWLPRARAWPLLAGLGAVKALGDQAEPLRELLATQGLVDLWWDAGTATTSLAPVRPDLRQYLSEAQIASAQPFQAWRLALEPALVAWSTQPDGVGKLLADRALDDARRWLQLQPGWLMDDERRFIQASIDRNVLHVPAAADDQAGSQIEAVVGRDVVTLEFEGGPTLALHPESARSLLDAGRGTQTSALSGVLLRAVSVLTVGGADKRPFLDRLAKLEIPLGQVFQAQGAEPFSDTAPVRATVIRGDGPRPALVLVAGTLIGTAASFGGLWRQGGGEVWSTLPTAYGSGIYALGHRSLGADPVDNALALAQACAPGTRLHLLTHGSGALVAEVLVRVAASGSDDFSALPAGMRQGVQQLADTMRRKSLTVARVVRVAGPARGLPLGARTLDATLSVLLWSCQKAGGQVLPAVRELVLEAVRQRVDPATLPGLAACLPDSALLRWLPSIDEPAAGELRVIAGRNTGGGGLGAWVKALVADAAYRTDNDLVVPTRSMFGGVPRQQTPLFFLGESDQTHHFGYFGDLACARAIVDALRLDSPPAFRPIGPLSWAGDSPTGVR